MASTDIPNNWDKIQEGVKETERLIGQKQYNMAMVKARQTLEFMVKLLGEKACLIDGDLIDNIDELYQGRWITKTTCEHYHKIRMIGNKAIHEGNDNAYDANQAYHLLSQEVYTFANEYGGRRRKASSGSAAASTDRRSASGNRSGSRQTTASRSSSGNRPAQRSASTGRQTARSASNRSRRQSQRGGFDSYSLMKIGIGILAVIFLIVLIRFISKPKETVPETTPVPTTTEATLPPETTAAPPETTEAVVTTTYKTTSRLNVRSGPSTDSDKLGMLELGVTVDYIQAYDDDWALIQYNGTEAYVSSQYLTTE